MPPVRGLCNYLLRNGNEVRGNYAWNKTTCVNKHMSLYLSETRPSQGDHHDQILEAHIKIRRTKLNIWTSNISEKIGTNSSCSFLHNTIM